MIRPNTILTLDSTLAEIPSHRSIVSTAMYGKVLLHQFNDAQQLPGILVMEGGNIKGVISRDWFFEKIGRHFGVEIFLNRPVSLLLEGLPPPPLVLSGDCSISLAANAALNREGRSVYEPVVIHHTNDTYSLISALDIFLAENNILFTLHNQHIFTVTTGLPLDDKEALRRFCKHANIHPPEDAAMITRQQTIQCDQCGQPVSFSIADVVRSHLQIRRGIEVNDRLSIRTYAMYVRHTCGKDIRETPVFFDEKLMIISVRESRTVESYI